MKKILLTFVAVAFLGVGAMVYMSTSPKAAEIVTNVTYEEGVKGDREAVKCHYPDDLDCPLTKEQEALLDVYHPINQEILDELYPEQQ